MTAQRRVVSYTWRLRQVMAEAGMYATTDLIGPLAERGVELSASQVFRLVTTPPERLNLTVLAALCDIFSTDPTELIEVESANLPARQAINSGPALVDPNIRPVRARIVADTTQP